jgi:hypothetical protein
MRTKTTTLTPAKAAQMLDANTDAVVAEKR